MLRLTAPLLLLGPPAWAQNTWGGAAQEPETGFSWTDPIAPGFWMAWTNATAAFFVFIFGAIALLAVIELRYPGGDERRGVFGLVTTRGDRLFISLLGSVYIFLLWLWLFGMPLWGALALVVAWFVFCFWKV